jgi:phytoene desaturase
VNGMRTPGSTNGDGPQRRVTVIGSGFGGLGSAIRLQAAGHQVTVVEAREKLGGRAYQLKDAGYTFDMGPSLITAPHLIRDLWTAAGRDLEHDVPLVPLDPFYRIYFRDGRHFDYGGGGIERDEAEIAKFNPDDVAGQRAFMRLTETIYRRAFDDLAGQSFGELRTFLGVVPELVRLGAQRSVYSLVSHYISDPYLRMVFSFHPLFIGGNPLRSSAIYSIVPYLERQGGVHYTMGGMYALIEGMERLFRDLGGDVITGERVERILTRRGRVAGVRTTGQEIAADAVVANSDVATTMQTMVPRRFRGRIASRRLRGFRYSMSCFLLYLGLDRQYDRLKHHTIIMPDDYERLLTEIFDRRGMPSDLALYLHAPSKSDPGMAPPGGESLYVLVPVPHLDEHGAGIDWERDGDAFRDRVIRFLEHEFGMEGLEASIVSEHRFTPLDFRDQLGSYLGSAFSIEPTLLQSAWLRPHNRSGSLPGLYFAGAGTHPGAGLPGTLLSAQITSGLVLEDMPPPTFAPAQTQPERLSPGTGEPS